MDEGDIERVITALERARDDLEIARAQAVVLPDTPHWSGSARYRADARTEELVGGLTGLVSTLGTMLSRARSDLAAYREAQRTRDAAVLW